MEKGDVLVDVAEYAAERFGVKPFDGTVPVSGAVISPDDVLSLVSVALDGWYTMGKECARFGVALRKETGKKYISLVNSGSSAALVAVAAALEVLNHRKFVLTSAVSFPTTLSAIYQNGQIPILIDLDPFTLQPDSKQIDYFVEKYGSQISGALFVHTLGFPFDEAGIRRQLPEGVWLISDGCDALGAGVTVGNRVYPIGYASDISIYSFYPAHQICAAEGGAVACDDLELHRVIESLTSWGRSCHCLPGQDNACGKRFMQGTPRMPEGWDHKYTFERMGYNLHMTEFQGALGFSQIQRLDEFTRARNENWWGLVSRLGKFCEWIGSVGEFDWQKPSPFGFPIWVHERSPFNAQDLILHLEARGVRTRRLMGGNLALQPAFVNANFVYKNLWGSNFITERMFWIGCWPGLTDGHLDHIERTMDEFFQPYL